MLYSNSRSFTVLVSTSESFLLGRASEALQILTKKSCRDEAYYLPVCYYFLGQISLASSAVHMDLFMSFKLYLHTCSMLDN